MSTVASFPVIEGLRVIDTDAHITEPHDLWTSRAPASLRDRVPQVKKIDGRKQWVVAGDVALGPAGAASVVRKDLKKASGTEFFAWGIEDVHESSWDMKARIGIMNQLGLYAQIIYPNLAGFGNQRFLAVDDLPLRNACVEIYNDAMAEIQKESGERIFPMALVPWWDIETAAREVERAHGLGLRGIVTCSDPDAVGLPDMAQSAWDVFWETCGELHMPINFHIAASKSAFDFIGRAAWPSLGAGAKLALASSNLFLDNARVVGNLIFGGVMERFPKCRFVSVESGMGWVPFFLEALDYQLAENLSSDELKKLKLKPSEYFKRQMYATFWFEKMAPQTMIDAIGADRIMFETDYPHPTCLYPDNREHVETVLKSWDRETQRRILQDNAAELYRIPLP